MFLICATAFAQTQVAILNHNEEISMFYGANALANANSAAVAGDIITLSSGTFNGCTITKPITLRGAGFENDSVTLRTSVSSLTLNIPADSQYHFTMEGISHGSILYFIEIHNPIFVKCYLYQFVQQTGFKGIDNATFINCMINDTYINTDNCSYNFINSYVGKVCAYNHILSYNSIIWLYDYRSGNPSYDNIYAYNSILIGKYSHPGYYYDYSSIGATSLLQNCIAIQTDSHVNLLANMSPNNNTNVQYLYTSDVFNSEGFYVLKEEIASSFLGDDGTEVGLYGGLYPYNTKPNYMVVKKCNVASRATVDNKLSVEIEVISE